MLIDTTSFPKDKVAMFFNNFNRINHFARFKIRMICRNKVSCYKTLALTCLSYKFNNKLKYTYYAT